MNLFVYFLNAQNGMRTNALNRQFHVNQWHNGDTLHVSPTEPHPSQNVALGEKNSEKKNKHGFTCIQKRALN